VMKEKKGIANKFEIFSDPNSGNVVGRNSKSMQFSFLKIVKIEPAIKVQIFFLQKEIPSVPVKHHFSYVSLH
jgi:hypothetical protein